MPRPPDLPQQTIIPSNPEPFTIEHILELHRHLWIYLEKAFRSKDRRRDSKYKIALALKMIEASKTTIRIFEIKENQTMLREIRAEMEQYRALLLPTMKPYTGPEP